MTELVAQIYLLPADFDTGTLWERIGTRYEVQPSSSVSVELVCLDTFDWRLLQKGFCLCRRRSRYFLEDGFGSLLLAGSGSQKKFPCYWDLEKGELRNVLTPLIQVRALFEQLYLERAEQRFALCNRDRKTVLRLTFRQVAASRAGADGAVVLPQLLLVEPLRGYPKPLSEIGRILAEEGVRPVEGTYNFLAEVLGLLGVTPSGAGTAFHLSRGKEVTVGEAVSEICLQLKKTMLHNLPGVQADIDSEFLHDFRVAVRRTRSLLTAMRKYLPADELAGFQAELRWLGTITGPTRDLDVYLLQKESFRAMLPPLLHPGLDRFFADLAGRRKRSLKVMRGHLASERFKQFLENWEKFLRQLPSHPSSGCKKNGLKVVRKIIRKRFRRMLREGSLITAQTPDSRLHELRIEGKKLRYMVGFFSSLWDAALVEGFIKRIKRLQSNLGDFNDLSVQGRMLAQRLGTLAGGDKDVEVAATLGGLIVHLGESQLQVRVRFEAAFETFSSQESVELLESILANGEGER